MSSDKIATALSSSTEAITALYVNLNCATLYASIVNTMPFARPSTSQVVHALGKMIKEGYPARGEVE
jgi:hypothetical protein